MSGWRIALALFGLAAYAALSTALMLHAPSNAWTLALLFAPLLAWGAVIGVRQRHWPLLAGCAAMAALLAAASGADTSAERLYVLQHAGLHAALGASFALTLRAGSVALITRLAERVHRERLTQAMRDYTRRLTAAWVGYFAAMVVASLALYASTPWSWWSLFSNVVSPLAATTFFVGELAWRRWRHPDFDRATLAQALRAYWHAPLRG